MKSGPLFEWDAEGGARYVSEPAHHLMRTAVRQHAIVVEIRMVGGHRGDATRCLETRVHDATPNESVRSRVSRGADSNAKGVARPR